MAEQSGVAQVVDVGLYEGISPILDELAPAYAHTGFMRERMGAGTVNAVPRSHYPTADGKWIAIACMSDKIFQRLASLMGRPELASDGKWGTTGRPAGRPRRRRRLRRGMDRHANDGGAGAARAQGDLRRCAARNGRANFVLSSNYKAGLTPSSIGRAGSGRSQRRNRPRPVVAAGLPPSTTISPRDSTTSGHALTTLPS